MRYLPHTPTDRELMMQRIGVSSVDTFYADVPRSALFEGTRGLPSHCAEHLVERQLTGLAQCNLGAGEAPFFCGGGLYYHHVPASVDHLIQRSEFLTSYTPYQPEISQGTLQVLFEFQTQVARMMGLDVANASMYDGSTATLEAVMMAQRITKRDRVVLSSGLHPHYAQIIKDFERQRSGADVHHILSADTPRDALDLDRLIGALDDQTACVVIQSPDVFGRLVDYRSVSEAAHAKGILVIGVVTEAISLGLLSSPGAMGADIAVGEGQSLGNGLNFGGPTVGLFATRQQYVRQMPGRLCGETVDATGRRGFVLTLSTREQHIRRNKATSNICTNSGLCALAFSIHMSLLGGHGLRSLALLNHGRARTLKEALSSVKGMNVINSSFFNEFVIDVGIPAAGVVDQLAMQGILGGIPLSRLYPGRPQFEKLLLVAATEMTSDEDIASLVTGLKEVRHG